MCWGERRIRREKSRGKNFPPKVSKDNTCMKEEAYIAKIDGIERTRFT